MTTADVCSDYLCGLCPYELFKNTFASRGECPKVHSEEAKQSYDESIALNPGISLINDHLLSLKDQIAKRNEQITNLKYIRRKNRSMDELKTLQNQIEGLERDLMEYESKRMNLTMKELENNLKSQHILIEHQNTLAEKSRQVILAKPSERILNLDFCFLCGCFLDDESLSKEREELHIKSDIHQAYVTILARITEIENQANKKPTIQF